MQDQQKYKVCCLCRRLIESQCANCAIWGFVWIIFAISDIISAYEWDIGVYGIIGAVFCFLIAFIYCIGSCNPREETSKLEYIEIIR